MSLERERGADDTRDAVLALVRDALRSEREIGGREVIAMQERSGREGEILDLSSAMIVPPSDSGERVVAPPQVVSVTTDHTEPRTATADVAPPQAVQSPAFSAHAFAALREAVRNRKPTVATHRGGPTIEDILREEMRPLLREWLDRNLSGIVERAVRQEVDRLSRQEEL